VITTVTEKIHSLRCSDYYFSLKLLRDTIRCGPLQANYFKRASRPQETTGPSHDWHICRSELLRES